MLVPFTMMDAYALAAPGDMYAGTGRNGPTDGAVFIASITGPIVETLVGDPTPGTDILPLPRSVLLFHEFFRSEKTKSLYLYYLKKFLIWAKKNFSFLDKPSLNF